MTNRQGSPNVSRAEAGFVIEGLLFIVAVAIIVVAGLSVYRHHHQTAAPSMPSTYANH